MNSITELFKDSELQSEFLKAKIIANPYDYKVSNRIFFEKHPDKFNKYNIFIKNDRTEFILMDALNLFDTENYLESKYMLANPNLHIKDPLPALRSNYDEFFDKRNRYMDRIHDGVICSYNNVIVNEKYLDMGGITAYPSFIRSFRKHKGLEGLEVWFLKCTSSESLIPDLLYLTTEYVDCTLQEIQELKLAKDTIAMHKAPCFFIRNDTTQPMLHLDTLYLSRYVIPGNPRVVYGELGTKGSAEYACVETLDNNIQRMSVGLSLVYLMELLYHFNSIKDKYPILEEYIKYLPTDSYLKYFYEIVDDKVQINPDLEKCFVNDNTTRFNSFKKYFNILLDKLSSKFLTGDFWTDFFNTPRLLGMMLSSVHAYAFQQLRVKHLMLLYTECKNKGIDVKKLFEGEDLGNTDFSLFGGSADTDNPMDELVDFHYDKYNADADSAENSNDDNVLEKSKKKEMPPTLDAVDLIKSDLDNSEYEFTVNYIKSTADNRSAYNNIAESVKMLTVNLSKQIREIKVYNSGGKINGQSRGKLDKKNLWKYRFDTNIFYNNNYKVKEMDLAFGIVLDESGSMCGEGIRNGRVVMIMLHEVLNSLGINHSIIGHTSHGKHDCIINKYYQFKEEKFHTLQKPYALAKINSKSGNCDSGALYYMQTTMKTVQNKDKIVIIFSDGEPTECSELELKKQVSDMEKSGVHVIGVGVNFESIKEYYPDNANGKNLKEMIDIVISILKRYVLEKKD